MRGWSRLIAAAVFAVIVCGAQVGLAINSGRPAAASGYPILFLIVLGLVIGGYALRQLAFRHRRLSIAARVTGNWIADVRVSPFDLDLISEAAHAPGGGTLALFADEVEVSLWREADDNDPIARVSRSGIVGADRVNEFVAIDFLDVRSGDAANATITFEIVGGLGGFLPPSRSTIDRFLSTVQADSPRFKRK